MNEILRTAHFDAWLGGLRDRKGQYRIEAQIDRLRHGNTGDSKPVGEGVWELRIDFGPGYRVYYVQYGKRIYLLLAGSDKSSQARAIKQSHQMAKAAFLQRKNEGKEN